MSGAVRHLMAGYRVATNGRIRVATEARSLGALTATSIVPSQVHSGIHVRYVLGVTIEHKCLPHSATEKWICRFTDALLACLAPSRMIHCGIDVRIKAIRLWPRFHPGTDRLFIAKPDLGDRLDSLEAIFPRRNES